MGGGAYWWDYGQLKLYLRNALRLAEDGPEADAMRAFLGVERKAAAGPCAVDGSSLVVASALKAGSVKKSVLAHVTCSDVDADGAVLVNVSCRVRAAGAEGGCEDGVRKYREGMSDDADAEASSARDGEAASTRRMRGASETRPRQVPRGWPPS